MRLNEEDIAKLKMLEMMDELEKVISSIKPSWLHPAQKVVRVFALRKLKKLRKELIFVHEEDQPEECGNRGPDSGRGYFYYCTKWAGHGGAHGFSDDNAIVQWPQ